jgi:hypothetical protein
VPAPDELDQAARNRALVHRGNTVIGCHVAKLERLDAGVRALPGERHRAVEVVRAGGVAHTLYTTCKIGSSKLDWSV